MKRDNVKPMNGIGPGAESVRDRLMKRIERQQRAKRGGAR